MTKKLIEIYTELLTEIDNLYEKGHEDIASKIMSISKQLEKIIQEEKDE